MTDTRQEEFEQAARSSYQSFIEDIDQGMSRLRKARGEDEEELDTCEDCGQNVRRDPTVKERNLEMEIVILCATCLADRTGEEVDENDPEVVLDEPEDEEDIYQEFDALDIEKVITVEVLLGTGGPACGFDLKLDSDGDVDSGEYWYQDWFTVKKRFSLSRDEIDHVVDLYRIDTYGYARGEY